MTIQQTERSITNTVRIGFGLVLTLTLILGLVGIFQIHQANINMRHIVEVSNTKTALAFSMRDAIRLRALSMNKILATQDPFKRDAELQNFYTVAGKYRTANLKLKSLSMNAEEKAIIKTLDGHIRIAQPLNKAAAERLLDFADQDKSKEFDQLLANARQEQTALLAALDKLVQIHKQSSQDALRKTNENFTQTAGLLMGVVFLMLALGILIARKVTRYVTATNRSLSEQSQKLVDASETALTTARQKNEFLASMSHEIRTPLSAIVGYSRILLEDNLSREEINKSATAITKSGAHLNRIINDVIDLTRIDTGDFEIELLMFSPTDLITEILEIMQGKARAKDIIMHTNIAPPVPDYIQSDPTRLKQILLNILGNAIKFTEHGHIEISFRYVEKYNQCKFSIQDTGIGMDKEEAARIYKPFSQANRSVLRKYGGTGLGLAISKNLAIKLGGDITCTSIKGTGTTFTIVVDAGQVSMPVILQTPGAQNPTNPHYANLTIPDASHSHAADTTAMIAAPLPGLLSTLKESAQQQNWDQLHATIQIIKNTHAHANAGWHPVIETCEQLLDEIKTLTEEQIRQHIADLESAFLNVEQRNQA